MTHTLIYPAHTSHNAAGHLEIDGCDIVDLVAEHGTPLMVYEEKTLRDQCRRFMEAFRSRTDDFEVDLREQGLLHRGHLPARGRGGPLHRRLRRRRVSHRARGRLPHGAHVLSRQQQDSR